MVQGRRHQIPPFLSDFEKAAKSLVTIDFTWLQGFFVFMLLFNYAVKLFGVAVRIAVLNLISEPKIF